MDRLTKEKRSWNMSMIRSRNTNPEKQLRSLLHRAGYRFRINVKELPGSPDIVLPKYRAVIFVHGCFWHRHHECKNAYMPKSNIDFWHQKFLGNIKRDEKNQALLVEKGWLPVVIWECEIKQNIMLVLGKVITVLRRQLEIGLESTNGLD